MGRPTKLTPELQERVCQLLRAGNFVDAAVKAAGISPATHYDWIKRGDPGRRAKKDARDRAYRAEVEAALDAVEANALEQIAFAARNGQWRAAAWYLERAHPDRWAKRPLG